MSWQVEDVRKGCTYERTFGLCKECRARIEQGMLDKGDAI